MKIPAQPQALNCPNCGGAVMSDRSQCEFCSSRLKTVGCPACLGLMFLGAKFCTHCGKKVAAAVIVDDAAKHDCPRCKRQLETLQIDAVMIRECLQCRGFWSDAETFEELCANSENQAAILGFIGIDAQTHPAAAAVSYVPCAECGELMNRSNFARSSGVIIDICKQHGVWFDADELPKILAFINEGGLARQREKERISIEDERQKLRDDAGRMAAIERRSGIRSIDDAEATSPILGGVIRFLLDR